MFRVQELEKIIRNLEKKLSETEDYCELMELKEEYNLAKQELNWYVLDMINKFGEREVV